jgi:hypothetical protein
LLLFLEKEGYYNPNNSLIGTRLKSQSRLRLLLLRSRTNAFCFFFWKKKDTKTVIESLDARLRRLLGYASKKGMLLCLVSSLLPYFALLDEFDNVEQFLSMVFCDGGVFARADVAC